MCDRMAILMQKIWRQERQNSGVANCIYFLCVHNSFFYKIQCITKKDATLSTRASQRRLYLSQKLEQLFSIFLFILRAFESNCHSVAHLSVDALMLTSFFHSFFFMRKLYSFGMLLMTTKKKSKMNRFSPKFYRFLKCHEDYLRFLSSKNKQQKTVWNIKL